MEFFHSRQKAMGDLFGGGNMHGGGKDVVGGLTFVDVVVGMNRFFGTYDAAGHLDSPVGYNLIGVHVALGAASGLPDDQGEMAVKFALDDLVGGFADQVGFVLSQNTQFGVGLSSSFFEDAEGADDFARHAVVSDFEILERTLGLGAPVTVGGDLDFAHSIDFGPVFHVSHD